MDFSRGRSFLAIPGPSVIPDAVLGAMHRPAVNIYEGPLVELTNGLLPDLKRIVGTEGEAMMYIANGHGGWEASLANLFGPGDRVLVLESGRFAVGWGEMARGMGVEARLLKGRPRRAVDPAAVEEALERADVPHVAGQQMASLSGGQFQRVLLARALLGAPDLLMLDEATQGLDQPGSAAFYRLLEELRAETGCAVLMVSHELHVVMAASDRVICLNGHVCCEGRPAQVAEAPAYRALFGSGTGGALALYRHVHDHAHDHDHGHASGHAAE